MVKVDGLTTQLGEVAMNVKDTCDKASIGMSEFLTVREQQNKIREERFGHKENPPKIFFPLHTNQLLNIKCTPICVMPV